MSPVYRHTVIEIEVLSKDDDLGFHPLSVRPRDATIDQVVYQINQGEWSGDIHLIIDEEVSEPRMRALLLDQGSDPGFLIDEGGHDELETSD